MFFALDIQLNYFDQLGCGGGPNIHEKRLIKASDWDSVMGVVEGGARALNLLLVGIGWRGGVGAGALLVLGFLVLALAHGLSEFWVLRSFSWAVPYFSSLAGHLLESALCETRGGVKNNCNFATKSCYFQ